MARSLAVVGAGGFVGRHFSQQAGAAGWRVVGYGRSGAPEGFPGDWTQLDLRLDPPVLPADVEAVVYLAQDPNFRTLGATTPDVFLVNSVAPLRWALSAAKAGARLFLYASTGSVYQPAFEPIAESAPLRRDNPYALSKVMGEQCLELIADRLSVVSMRLFGVYGSGQEGMLVPNLVARVRRGEPITLGERADHPEDRGGFRISLTHVEDLAQAILDLIERSSGERLPWTVANVACARAASVRQLAEVAAEVLGREARFEPAPSPRDGDLIADTRRFSSTVGTQFRSLDAGLREMLRAGSAGK